ncbi:chromatin-binding/pre-rRNA-processing protein IPI3 [Ascoidea rubescens DSM 1968]|uniref:Pre-rRNA-processing protein IPI3 n=1 Tax=Ascoidea rubescens DSM 1968 TaxID=1344418 RepID=A0A1D2VGM2_9ASCO|nr:WD40 repeat-like protein [Ascoidea rubescens DSM 1968]ODV60786.1 WD40 repeat-like protein [Ascoidea rubescens DSM 1968]
MDENVFYLGGNDDTEKYENESVAYYSSIHSNSLNSLYKQANAFNHSCALINDINDKDNLHFIISCRTKALIYVYNENKHLPIQRIPIPEILTSLILAYNSQFLIGGSKTGKIYIWELKSGNLIFNQNSHYQQISILKLSANNNYLISGSNDSKINIYKFFDLVSVYKNNIKQNIKPIFIINDHTLPVTDLFITKNSINNDIKLFTTSLDSTCRIYNLIDTNNLNNNQNESIKLKSQTTFVLPNPIHSIIVDPLISTIYLGLNNGLIRQINLFKINKFKNNLLESLINTNGEIINIPINDQQITNNKIDQESNNQEQQEIDNDLFKCHQITTLDDGKDEDANTSDEIKITNMDLSLDSTILISGDSTGKVFASDIVTKNIIKTFKEVKGSVSFLKVIQISKQSFLNDNNFFNSNKNNNSNKNKSKLNNNQFIPQLKRYLIDNDSRNHILTTSITNNSNNHTTKFLNGLNNFNSYLNRTTSEEFQFKNYYTPQNRKSTSNQSLPNIKSVTLNDDEKDAKIKELESKLKTIKDAYGELRNIHEELYKQHFKLIKNKH